VPETTSERPRQIVGREAELAALEEFLESSDWPRAFVLTGEPGVGKTTLWEAGVELGRRRGLRVLAARGSSAETQLSSAGLIDLLDAVSREELAELPQPQLQALEVALFRTESADTPPGAHAVALGLLSALRSLADRGQLLVAVDDTQWLDQASEDALAFAARRIDTEAVAFLLARRPGASSAVERALDGKPLRRLDVRQLSLGATRRILSERLGLSLTRNVLRHVYETTLGNPLFTLEVGRMLAAHEPLEIVEDVPLPDTVEELLGTRIEALPAPMRRLLLAVALSADLRTWQAGEIVATDALDDAVDSGVLVVDGDRLRPAHPLFATAARSSARSHETRELHRALAQLASDDESRAEHLALAADRPDEELAASVGAAAAGAAARGARHEAVVLADHALRLTPPDSPERNERLLVLGTYLVPAGAAQRLTDLLVPELDSLPSGETRARAFLLLTNGIVSSNDEIRSYLDKALAESTSNATLHASVLIDIAENETVIRVRQIPEAESWVHEALEGVEPRSPALEREAMYALAWMRALRGRPLDEQRERFRAASDAAMYVAASPERVAGQQHFWRGEIEQARAVLSALLALADERGEPYAYALLRLHMCQLALRTGDWGAGERLLDEWAQSSERVMWPMYQRCRGLLAAGRGHPEEAERWAAETLARADATGTGWDRLEGLRARGTAALLTRESARAAESLREVWEHTQREGVDEPGVFPVAPELVEALVELGELEEATAVTDRLRRLSEEQAHPWGLATAARSSALVRLASDRYDEEAAIRLSEAADAFAGLGLPFDRARSLLVLGRAQRRLRKWGAARDSLAQAAAELDGLGSPGWAAQARSELDRVGGRRPQDTSELTTTERRVCELAADGLANKEIAETLFMSVRTVEVHLKHAYAKLDVRSRTQLARRLSERT
jgi:DNA-binding CsgD family transcriptional regulator